MMEKLSHLGAFITLSTVVMIKVLVANCLLVEGLPNLSHYLLTKPQVLFSLRYGKSSSQIGMFIPRPLAVDAGEPSGPSDFVIGPDGSIYIGDQQNGKVKKFNRKGNLLMVTEGQIDRIAGMTVDNRGWIYVIHGVSSDEVAVYDQNGRRLPEIEQRIKNVVNELSNAIAPTEPQIWREIKGGRVPSGRAGCDEFGNLYFDNGQFTVKIDSQFTKAWVFKGRYPYIQEQTYSYQLLPPEKQIESSIYGVDGKLVNQVKIGALKRFEITIYGGSGEILRQFVLPKGEWREVEKLLPIGGGSVYCDRRGHFYTLRSSAAAYHVALRPDNPKFYVVRYSGVVEYDEKGNFVGLRAILSEFTMPSVHWFEVDAQGNVYWLDFKAYHLDVMMAPTP